MTFTDAPNRMESYINASDRSRKIELATHLLLGQIGAFSGHRNKARTRWNGCVDSNSHESRRVKYAFPTEDGGWCITLTPTITRKNNVLLRSTQSNCIDPLLAGKERGQGTPCDYLNRLNGYARNACKQLQGNRYARDHVGRFLEICGDRGLERRLYHENVYDIHELDEIIVEILKVDDRESANESAQSRFQSHGTSRSKRSDHPRECYTRNDRSDRDFGRHCDDSRNIPRITYTEAAKASEVQKMYTSDEDDRHGISTENELEKGNNIGRDNIGKSTEDSLETKPEGQVSRVVQESPRRRLNTEVRLLPGARMGWWSAQKFDQRVRVRTLVEGAVNDQRTRIPLDTAVNVSIVSA
ncbi:Eukaryotic/viral aspartic protease [Phytophthora megakarya]|uniref:Eukaryotic/viral aspartic protease n=1 Tax=Phytophthora megakarya TaxID=4795 RepID=A0A225V7N3_9STRA|nr:Eukaryotic/viral aspartic protease [Phytophthora megakarya]